MAPWDPASTATQLLASPLLLLLRPIYSLLSALRPPPLTRSPSTQPIRVVCLSDTHSKYGSLSTIPEGDLLIHAGDLTDKGTSNELQAAVDWLNSLPHAHKVVVAGNHDSLLDKSIEMDDEKEAKDIDWGNTHYLQNDSVILQVGHREIRLHGVPQIPRLEPITTIHAFQYPSPTSCSSMWSDIPSNIDVLVSHSPPLHHRDLFPHSIGCPHLLRTDWRVKPALHVFGHVHLGRGVERVYYDDAQRAWEDLCDSRCQKGPIWERGERCWSWTFLYDLSPRAWYDASRVIFGSICGIFSTQTTVLGREGWMVNPACMDNSGNVVAGPIVIDI